MRPISITPYGYKVCYTVGKRKTYTRKFITHSFKKAKEMKDHYYTFPPFILSAEIAKKVGVVITLLTGSIGSGLEASLATFGAINNLTNAIYYNYISDGESDLTSDSYKYGHINRWDRLDYTKKMTQDQTYNLNAWRYFSEYNFHMYAWRAFGWALDKNIPLLSGWANSAEKAAVDPKDFERDDHGQYTWRNIVYILVGLLGL